MVYSILLNIIAALDQLIRPTICHAGLGFKYTGVG